MIVGEHDSMSLWSDVSRLPSLIFEFVAFVPNEIASMLRRGGYISAISAIAAFGVFSEFVCWAVTNKMFWTFGGGKQITGLRFWGLDGIVLMMLAVIVAFIANSIVRPFLAERAT